MNSRQLVTAGGDASATLPVPANSTPGTGPARVRWVGPGAVAFLVLWLILLAGGRSGFLRDPGSFWHVTTGEHILAEGFIRTDPYTFSFAGQWWVPFQWLGEVVMALVHRAGGYDALLLGTVTVVAAVYAGLAVRLLRTGLNPAATGAVVFWAVAVSASHFHVRPHLFTIAGMAVTAALLADVDSGRASTRRLFWLVPLYAVWTNVHGGVLGGMATLGLVSTGWVVFRALGLSSPVRTGVDAARVAAAAGACGLTALASPYGLDMVRVWHVIMGEPVLRQVIQEHRPLDPAEPFAWPVLAFAGLYLFVLAGAPVRRVRVTWLLPLVWLALTFSRVRHAPLFAVTGLVGITAVWPHTRWAAWLRVARPDFYQPPASPPRTPLWADLWLPAAVVLLAFGLQVANVPVPVVGAGWARHDPHHWPVDLLDVLKANEPTGPAGNHLFNGDVIDGGFVIYHAPGYKTFADDRCELFGGDWLVNFVRAESAGTAGAIAGWEAAYGRFDFALTRTGTGFDDYFARAPGWDLVKRTETAAFYRRK